MAAHAAQHSSAPAEGIGGARSLPRYSVPSSAVQLGPPPPVRLRSKGGAEARAVIGDGFGEAFAVGRGPDGAVTGALGVLAFRGAVTGAFGVLAFRGAVTGALGVLESHSEEAR